jgi:hypothetical protein
MIILVKYLKLIILQLLNLSFKMKVTTIPETKKECSYFSDFTGKNMGNLSPIKLTIEFSENSICDGNKIELHLDDDDIKEVITYIKSKLKNCSL